MDLDERPGSWSAFLSAGDAVRAPWLIEPEEGRSGHAGLLRAAGIAAGCAVAAALAVLHLAGSAAPAAADSGADGTLFSLTNSDRASNGVASLSYSGTLQTIGEGGYYGGCGFAVHGRSVDMIERNYFAHPILNCGQLVFSIMQAYGVPYRSAGENIGWVSGETSGGAAANYINGAFMNSPDHRANILDGNYTEMGVGSDATAPGQSWTGAGSPGYTNVWIFSEEFAQVGNAGPPPPPPTPRPTSGGTPRNSPAPPAPAQAPATTTPAPTPRPTPTPIPVPAAVLPAFAPAPLNFEFQGLLPSSVESVLEAYLDD
ncbi:MAG: hypothetical protein JOY68_00455 [Candidatus Dormibacteraeota bacterium]|nr:hypothetical protein [Candidatus Dormibacteraeota bacterium]